MGLLMVDDDLETVVIPITKTTPPTPRVFSVLVYTSRRGTFDSLPEAVGVNRDGASLLVTDEMRVTEEGVFFKVDRPNYSNQWVSLSDGLRIQAAQLNW